MEELYQNIPSLIDPVAFRIGDMAIRWYSLMYLVGFMTVYFLLRWRVSIGESKLLSKEDLIDFLVVIFLGLVMGARFGYVLFYNPDFYFHNPLAIFFPYDFSSQKFIGISGMSYHGGLLGALVAGWIFTRSKKMEFWKLADFLVPAIPLGYFFGRIGNFLNGELYGRVTSRFWGMRFPLDANADLRHPSQLYEAFFEGIGLFVFLWSARNHVGNRKGKLLWMYVFGYGLVRFLLEFYREPDPEVGLIGNIFSLGQLFSIVMIVIALVGMGMMRKLVYNKE